MVVLPAIVAVTPFILLAVLPFVTVLNSLSQVIELRVIRIGNR